MTSPWHRTFLDYLEVLDPYLDQLVIVGGWAPYVYARKYGWDECMQPLQTFDFDVAVMRTFEDRMPSIEDTIFEAGFEREFRGENNPPAIDYRRPVDNSDGAMEIQFITQSCSSDEDVIRIGSLNVVALSHVSLLTENMWKLDLQQLGFAGKTHIRVPTPGAFAVQKLVSHESRPTPRKREKDLYYAYYVLDSFPHWTDAILSETRRIVHESGLASKLSTLLESKFVDVDSPGVTAIMNQYPDSVSEGENFEQLRQRVVATMQQLRFED